MLFYSENIYVEDRAYSWMAEMCLICFIILVYYVKSVLHT